MIICLDLGATEIKVASWNGKLSDVKKVPTDASLGKAGILVALEKAVKLFLCDEVCGIAVASAGNIDSQTKIITYATENLPGMTGFSFGEFFQKKFNLPCTVLNDAHAALLGEMFFGSGRAFPQERVAMLTLGSGVGGAYFFDGIVSDESNDFCRFGHICIDENGRKCTCGKNGCAEMYLSGRALHSDAIRCGVDGSDLFKNARLGVEKNVEFVKKFRANLSLTLEKIQKICPFDVCVIGGGVVDWMGENFDEVTKDLGYKIVKAQLGNTAGVFGAYVFYCGGKL